MIGWKPNKEDWSMTNFSLAVVVLVATWPFAAGLRDWLTGAPLRLETVAVVETPPVNDPQLAAGVSGVYTGQAIFTIEHPTTAQWLTQLLVPTITLATAIVCVTMVARLVRHARRDDPFNPRAHLAVRVLGLVLLCYGLFAPLVGFLMTAVITTGIRGGELNMAFQFEAASAWPVLVGLVVAAVGESVFDRGRKLTEDVEGLV